MFDRVLKLHKKMVCRKFYVRLFSVYAWNTCVFKSAKTPYICFSSKVHTSCARTKCRVFSCTEAVIFQIIKFYTILLNLILIQITELKKSWIERGSDVCAIAFALANVMPNDGYLATGKS